MGFDSQRQIASPTGAMLNLYSRRAKTVHGVVQINHGLAEHAARYAGFAHFLAAHGFHVYAHDHRGHGLTIAPDAPRGMFATENGRNKVIADVSAVHDLIASECPALPVVVFGHSMGGLIALNFLFEHSPRVHAAAIWNANFSASLAGRAAQAILAWEKFRLGSDTPSRLLPRLTFQAWGKAVPDHRTPFDWLSRDPAEVDKYIADPLCGWNASVSMWQDVFGLIFGGADEDSYRTIARDMPFNMVGGGQDPATDYGKAVVHLEKRMRSMAFSNLFSIVYPQTRHEGLNELNREEIMADFAAWLDRMLPRDDRKRSSQNP